jgi:hypothetical protein
VATSVVVSSVPYLPISMTKADLMEVRPDRWGNKWGNMLHRFQPIST